MATKTVNRRRIQSLEHAVFENKFTLTRVDGTVEHVSQFNEPAKYARLLREYGYSYP